MLQERGLKLLAKVSEAGGGQLQLRHFTCPDRSLPTVLDCMSPHTQRKQLLRATGRHNLERRPPHGSDWVTRTSPHFACSSGPQDRLGLNCVLEH